MSTRSGPPPALLRRRLSAERLLPYERAAGRDLGRAVRLYEWNGAVSASFHQVLGLVEVLLRNAMHEQLSRAHERSGGLGEWFDDPAGVLEPRRRHDIEEARLRLRRDSRPETPGRMVAELSFGFWRFLLASRYETTLWTPALRHAFPGLRRARRDLVYAPVQDLVQLRNRVAHHEPIHDRPLGTLYERVLWITAALDPELEPWIRRQSTVLPLLRRRP